MGAGPFPGTLMVPWTDTGPTPRAASQNDACRPQLGDDARAAVLSTPECSRAARSAVRQHPTCQSVDRGWRAAVTTEPATSGAPCWPVRARANCGRVCCRAPSARDAHTWGARAPATGQAACVDRCPHRISNPLPSVRLVSSRSLGTGARFGSVLALWRRVARPLPKAHMAGGGTKRGRMSPWANSSARGRVPEPCG